MATKKKVTKTIAKKETPIEEEPKEEVQAPVGNKPTSTEVSNALKSDKQKTKEALDAQPKVTFHIPLMPGEKEGAYDTVCINGYMIQIQKGVMTELPQQVAEMLANKYKVNMDVMGRMAVSRSEDVQRALE